MEFVIERESLYNCLSKLQGISEKRNTMPILANALLRTVDGELEIVATDLEVSVVDRCEIQTQVSGSVTVNSKKLFEVVRELPSGPVSIETNDEHHMSIKAQQLDFALWGMAPDDFPKVPELKDYSMFKASGKVIKHMIDSTIFSCGGEEGRYALNGLFITKVEEAEGMIRMVGTDGHRLAMLDREFFEIEKMDIEGGIILPKKGAMELSRVLEGIEEEINIGTKENNMAFEIGKTQVFMRLIDGDFPDYKRVIVEDCNKRAVADREELLRNIRRVSLLVEEKARAIKFNFLPGKLIMDGNNPYQGKSHTEMEIDYDGEEMLMGFNDKYLLDLVTHANAEKIVFEMRDEKSAIVVKLEDDPYFLAVIMPIRLS